MFRRICKSDRSRKRFTLSLKSPLPGQGWRNIVEGGTIRVRSKVNVNVTRPGLNPAERNKVPACVKRKRVRTHVKVKVGVQVRVGVRDVSDSRSEGLPAAPHCIETLQPD